MTIGEEAVVMVELTIMFQRSFLVQTRPMSDALDWIALVVVLEILVVYKADSAVGAANAFGIQCDFDRASAWINFNAG
jgi:hypothetical protein